jgi:hypothetical protein
MRRLCFEKVDRAGDRTQDLWISFIISSLCCRATAAPLRAGCLRNQRLDLAWLKVQVLINLHLHKQVGTGITVQLTTYPRTYMEQFCRKNINVI